MEISVSKANKVLNVVAVVCYSGVGIGLKK